MIFITICLITCLLPLDVDPADATKSSALDMKKRLKERNTRVNVKMQS